MINLEEIQEKLRKRKEKKEFIRTELRKGEVVGKFKFTTPKDISKIKSVGKKMVERTGPKTRQLVKKTFQKPKASNVQLAMAREKTKQMQLQMRQQRRMDVEQLAAQQRATYEQDHDMPMYPQQQIDVASVSTEQFAREQMIAEKMPKQRGGFGEAWRKFKAGQPTRERTRPVSMLAAQPSMTQANPVNNLLTPMGSPLVREPANLAAPINNKIPWRFKIW